MLNNQPNIILEHIYSRPENKIYSEIKLYISKEYIVNPEEIESRLLNVQKYTMN